MHSTIKNCTLKSKLHSHLTRHRYKQFITYYILNKQLLRKPENLHFDSEEDACTYFDDLVCDNAWDGNDEICNILVNCYVNGVLYRPVYYQREFDRGGCCIKMERVDD